MKLHEELSLPTADRYVSPGDPGAILPLVYGDFMSEDVSSPTQEIGGATPAVLIDRTNGIWLVNNGKSHPDTPFLYMENRKQDASTYAYNPAAVLGDKHGNVHTVAVVTIDPAIVGLVLEKPFSVRMKGLVDADDQLITNPITAIQHAFTTHGNWVSTDFDAITCNKARDVADALGTPVHWMFTDVREYAQHLTDLLFHYHGKFTTNLASQLVITLPQEGYVPSDQILHHLEALRDVDAPDPEDEVEWDLDIRNVVNELHLSYQYSWAVQDYAKKDVIRTAPASITFYHIRKHEKRLPGIRTEHHLNQWASIFLNRFALFPAIIRFPLLTTQRLGLLPSAYATMTWGWGPGAHGEGWTQRIVEVLNAGVRLRAQQQPLECFDTGLTLVRPNYLPMEDPGGTARFLRTLPDGRPEVLTYPPGEVAMIDTVVFWVSRQAPDNTTWYIYPDDTAEGRLVSSTVQPSGVGISAPLVFIDRFGRARDVRIIDNIGRIQFVRGL